MGNASRLEALQGKSNIFHCSDYMYPSSMAHAMAYAARLAKNVATVHGCEIHQPRLLGSRRLSRNAKNFSEFAKLKVDLTRDRRCLTASATKKEKVADDSSSSEVSSSEGENTFRYFLCSGLHAQLPVSGSVA